MIRAVFTVALFVGFAAGAFQASGRLSTGARAFQASGVFRSGIEVVELDVSVTRGGQPVQGLTAADFALTDNGIAQDVQSVMLDRLPLSVTMLLDVSESVAGDRLAHLVQAGEGLAGALRADDRAALITFSNLVTVAVPMTSDLPAIRSALRAMRGVGATALRDAVHLALELQPRNRTRPLLLVFTDGRDTTSWLSEDAVIDSARRIGVVVHAVRVESDQFLDRLADSSGGRTWSATSDRQLRELFTRALDEMRARYLLTYTPRSVSGPGWHDLKVRLRNGRADITARPGYFVAAASPSGSSPPQ
jgi:VWFA-related protein